MKWLFSILFLTMTFAMNGCQRATPAALADVTPMSLDEWKRIQEDDVKYDPQTLARLKAGGHVPPVKKK